MKFRFFTVIFIFSALLQMALVSIAGTINQSDVDKFTKTMEVLNKMVGSDQFVDIDDISTDGLAGLIDSDGKLIVLNRMVQELKSQPSEYMKLRNATEQGGFSTPQDWARVGDKVMLVYFRAEMNPSDLSDMADIPPELMAMMSPAAKEQLDSGLMLINAMENVSDADLETLKPYKKRLGKALD